MLKLLSDGKESTTHDFWNHKELNQVDCSTNGEVLSIVYFRDMIFSGHSDGTIKVTYGVVKEPVPWGPGPWVRDGGKPWDDGVYTGIKEVYIIRGDVINSIQIEYDRGGQSVWSIRHGSSGEKTNRIKFDYPNEVFNCISCYISSAALDGMNKVVKSLKLHTTRGKYGPFGEEPGTYFTSATTEGKVVGFHRRTTLYVDAIGVHMQHWLGERKPVGKSMLSKYFF